MKELVLVSVGGERGEGERQRERERERERDLCNRPLVLYFNFKKLKPEQYLISQNNLLFILRSFASESADLNYVQRILDKV